MIAVRRSLNFVLLFSVVWSGSVQAGVVVPAKSGGPSFSPIVVQGWATSINGLFNSPAPNLMALNLIVSPLRGVDLNDPTTRKALAPIYAAVQSQAQTLQANTASVQAAPVNSALATKYAALGILEHFQLPESRSQVAERSRVYQDALPAEEKERIRANLLMLKMESIARALGRTSAGDVSIGAGADSASLQKKMPDSWKLKRSPLVPSPVSSPSSPAPAAAWIPPSALDHGPPLRAGQIEAPVSGEFKPGAPAGALGAPPQALPENPKAADLPPAGPRTGLDEAQLRWLYRTLVADPSSRALTRHGFSALVMGQDMAAAAGASAEVRGKAMYDSLWRVVDSGLPAAERGRMAYALNRRFAAILDAVLSQSSLSEKDRLALARTKEEFLDDPVVLEELGRRRQTLPKLDALEKAVQAVASDGAAEAPAHGQWSFGAAIPKAERAQGSSVEEYKNSLPAAARRVEAMGFEFEKLQRRWEIASRGEFSPRFREKIRAALEESARDSLRAIRYLNQVITRIATVSLPKGFGNPGSIDGRRRGIIFVPDNENLRLRVRGGTAFVTADFETNIGNDKVLQMIKTSIEDYWEGKFVFAGKRMRFKTTVNIRKLAPGRDFSSGSLPLREAVDTVAHAGKGGIVFDRDLGYDVAAHEFGHVLGLADEYTEGYRAADRTAVGRQNTESLMGALGGDILPRHLKTAYQLLRRRSLQN